MPLMPPRPPSLSAVLIAHERRDSLRRLPPALFVAMGAAAVFALVAYIRWRATAPPAEDGTVFTAPTAPTAPAPSASVAVPVDKTPTPWNPVVVDAGVVAPKTLPAKAPDTV